MKEPEIKHIAIVGAGTMGPRIAYRCIVSGLETFLYDKFPEALEKGMKQIQAWVAERTKDGRLTGEEAEAALARLHSSTTLQECVSRAGLIIETVPENLELKRKVFAEIDQVAPPGAFLCTNSSSLPCSRVAGVTRRPERVFNINFSDPTRDDLAEVMKGAQTANETVIAGERFVRSLNMVPIVTLKEIMGFSFNRVWRAIKREVLHLVDDGYSSFEDLDRAWMLEFGTPYGPFGLMDIIGLDVIRDIEKQYYLDSGEERDKPPKLLDDLIRQGRLGVKTGRGFYSYPEPEYKNRAWLRKEGHWSKELLSRLSLKEE